MTGKINEFEGFGLKATFREIAVGNVVAAAQAADMLVQSDEANRPDYGDEAFWLRCRPYYILRENDAKLPSGVINHRAVYNIATAIRTSITCGRFEALVIVDDEFRPLGFFPSTLFGEILRIPLVVYGTTARNDLAEQILTTELGVVLQHPSARARSSDATRLTFPSSTSVKAVYDQMVTTNNRVAVITDRLGRFDGIVSREAIEGWFISQLLSKGDVDGT